MITKSTTRIHAQTTPVMKERFRQRLVSNIQRFIGADHKEIDQRIEELDSLDQQLEIVLPALAMGNSLVATALNQFSGLMSLIVRQ